MQPTTNTKIQKIVVYPQLPLAIYREIAAHLSQIAGVSVTTLPQQAQDFDYYQSQIGGLSIEYNQDLDSASLALLNQILEYYQSDN